MGLIKGMPNPSNTQDWMQLRRFTAMGLALIAEQVNGNLSFDNFSAAGPFTVVFTGSSQLVVLKHNLGRVPSGFQVIKQNAASILYAPDANPWTDTTVFLKSSAAGSYTFYLI